MDSLKSHPLPDGALLLVDTAPIIYQIENHPRFAGRFRPLFEAHAAGRLRFAVTTITLIEVMAGPLQRREEALAERYRRLLESWVLVALDAEIAASAARLRASHGFKLADAVQLATAIAINADGLVTHDRDFARFSGFKVLS